MITKLEKQNSSKEIFDLLNLNIKNWFEAKFGDFSEPQRYSIIPIHNKENILVSSPTGSGKTLTAFMAILNELVNLSEAGLLEDRVYCVYVSPLKALSRDIEKNLKEPLNEIELIAKKKFGIRVGVRTGDTSQAERSKMFRNPPHILISTPESLAIMLTTTKFREYMRDIKWFIVDEVHALAENKRGVDLSLSLERLEDLSREGFCRVGLSATIAPLEEIAKFLVGNGRLCKVVDVQFLKKLDLKVLSPVKDFIDVSSEEISNKLYELIDRLVQDHKTTLIFTNTRSATERVVHYLKDRFPKNYTENIGAHHGSLSKDLRLDIEERLREGKLKCIVCSTSLELGIDIGYIDLVILLGSPKSVARGMQRIGRSGHKLHETAKGRIIVLDRDDLVENSVLLKAAVERKIDKIHIPKNCLDVLAQHINGIAISDRINIKDLFKIIKRSYCYTDLKWGDYLEVIEYLSGKYVTLEDRHIYAKIWYDEETGEVGKRGKMARILYMTNSGTIPESTGITVKIGEQKIGTIEEGFLERMKTGDVFVLGGQTYEFLFSRGQTAQVKVSVNRPPTVPRWFSDMLPLSFDLANEIGKFRKYMNDLFKKKNNKEEIIKFINEYLYVDKDGAEAIYEYFRLQYEFLRIIPNKDDLIVEHYSDSDDKKYVIFHSLYGRRVNDALSRVMGYAIGKQQHRDVEIGINDNGFYISSDKKVDVMKAFKLMKSDEIYKGAENAIEFSEILKRRFRHCATRAFMILKVYKGRKKRVGRQQVSSMILMNAVKRISKDFCILKEARREVLEDLMDINSTKKVLEDIESGKIKVKEVDNKMIPSPFSFNLIVQGYADIMKIEDKIQFLKRMHNNVLAKIGI